MRALTVVQLVPRLDSGGAERSTLEIGEALVRAGHRSIVVSAGGRLVPRLEAHGSEHVALDLARKSPATLFKVPALRRTLAALAPDIVHARSRLPAWIAWLALRGVKPRPHFVTTVHGRNTPGRYSAILTRGERVICVSESVRRYVLEHYPSVSPDRLVVIPRGVDADAYPFGHAPDAAWRARHAAEFPSLQGLPLLVMPARGTRLKGHADALRVLAALEREHGIRAALLMPGTREAGREAYVAELEALAASLGIAARVAMCTPRDDLRDLVAHAACVLQLSTQAETFGRTVVESLSLGVPVVGYAHGGVGELLADVFPDGAVAPGDVAQVAARVAAILAQRPAMQPLAGYTLADMQRRTLALYAEVAA
jgi:glycosyltransferase involved in cell wall biosynthesis